MEQVTKNVEETAEVAKEFASKLEPKQDGATVVGLYGELGAGKTTFMKYLAEYFGVEETVQSPTFVIEKIYSLKGASKKPARHASQVEVGGAQAKELSNFQTLIHIDAYRIEKEEEMINLGWNKIIADSKNLICVEWPERIEGIMPVHTKIILQHLEENSRKIIVNYES